jgi:hypothetical protein
MDTQRIMKLMDASYRTRRTIEHSLHEIDRRALNAMVLVKRHGNKLAGYGVVAQAFREQAAHLKEAAEPLQQSIAPLVRAHMRILQHSRYAELFQRIERGIRSKSNGNGYGHGNGNGGGSAYRIHADSPANLVLGRSQRSWEQTIAAEEAEAAVILRQLVQTVIRLQEGIAEQEYVVTNGRIEAALSEQSGAPLMRVSQEMGLAVATVRDAIWEYRSELEEVLHESSAGF